MKVDVTKIEGYAEMSAEDKVKALEAFEIAEPDYTGYVKKEVFDKASSEAADYKKQLKAKMTEDEQKEADRAAKEAEQLAELERLRKEKKTTEIKAQYLALGYDEKMAAETAEAFVSGDTAKCFENQRKFQEGLSKKVESKLLDGTDRPPNGDPKNPAVTQEQFDAMGYSERLKVFNEQPELFKQFTEG